MNKIKSRNIVLTATLLVLACAATASGQSPFDPARAAEASRIREHIVVFTDRSIYASDETIHFRADHSIEGIEPGTPWSKAMYAELVNASGKTVANGKFTLLGGVGKGSLHIPSGELTGNYFLKCYTRWMRNAGPGSFSYMPLKIINPNRAEVANGTNGGQSQTQYPRVDYQQGELICSATDTVFGRGEEIWVGLSGPQSPHLDQMACCVTVVPIGGIDTLQGQLVLPSENLKPENFQVNFLPDLGPGGSFSGSVVKSDNSPAKYTTLYFSLLGKNPDFFASATDMHGRFALSSPSIRGDQELFVSVDPGGEEIYEVRIDQDFDNAPLPVSTEKFSLSKSEKEVATRMALQMQFSRVYAPAVQIREEATKTTEIPFYGTHIQRLMIDDYIFLPTLEEVFINLVPNVDIVRRKGRSTFKINSDNSAIGIYDPLIMIDYISVFDQEAVLSLSPEKIERIDLINEIYLKGNVIFGGIISIFSKNGDMAGIDLPPGSYFFDYQSLQHDAPASEPSYVPGDRVPDSRNTLLWLDDVLLEKGKLNMLSFKAPDHRGEYLIVVRGVASNGEVYSATHRFVVE